MRHFRNFVLLAVLLVAPSTASAQARPDPTIESNRIQAPKLGIVFSKSEQLHLPKTFSGIGNLTLGADSTKRVPHGVIGGTIGAVVGGALGYMRVGMNCEGGNCDATGSVLTGAAIGAVVGIGIEYFVRHARG